MPADNTFEPGLVFNPVTSTIIRNETGGQLYAQTTDPTPVTIYDLLGNVITELVTNELGLCLPFKAGIPMGYVKFGTLFQPVISYEAQLAGVTAAAAQLAAEAAAAEAEAARTGAQAAQSAAEAARAAADEALAEVRAYIDAGGGGGGGGGGPVTSGDITDSTAIGRALITALDAPAVRTLIGSDWWYVGTGNPEGNVVAVKGSLFRRTDGGSNSTFYVKISGTGNTGWEPLGKVTSATDLQLGAWVGLTPASVVISDAAAAQLAVRQWVVYWTGTAWPARPSGAPDHGVGWDSAWDVSAPPPPAGTTAGHDGDRWFYHPDATV